MFWKGTQGTFFGLHQDGTDEMVLNYVVEGRKKWWIVHKHKEEEFERVMGELLGPYSSEKHILRHESLWMDGDWLA